MIDRPRSLYGWRARYAVPLAHASDVLGAFLFGLGLGVLAVGAWLAELAGITLW